MVVGGPTTVLDLGGLRVVSDPTFDDPGPHGYLTKTAGPAVAEDQLGPVDLVLVPAIFPPERFGMSKKDLIVCAKQVAERDWASGAVSRAVHDAQAATMAAVTAAVTAATTAASTAAGS